MIGEARQIFQIAATESGTGAVRTIYALCDDGTLWSMTLRRSDPRPPWLQLPPIPQGISKTGRDTES